MIHTRMLLISLASVLISGTAYSQNSQPCIENAQISPAVSSDSLTRQIAALELHLADMRIVYEEEHPSVRKLEVQVQALRTERDGLLKLESLARQIAVIESHLTNVRTVYGEDHPSVRILETQIQTLRDQYKALAK